jgi:predicted nucleic acid-binding Zn ribbon protein
MPIYTYRREDGTTFDFRQKFTDDALVVDPETGQHVTRVIQPAGVIFKGSGFYINDSKSASHSAIGTPKSEKGEKSETTASAEKSDHADHANKSEKSEKADKAEKAETTASKPAASTESAPKATAPAAAD